MDDQEKRVVGGQDCNGGEFIAFDPPFAALPRLAFNDQGMEPGDVAVTAERGPDGFRRDYFNATGEPISRQFDFAAIGERS